MNPRGRAELLLFGTTFLWAGTFVVVKLGLSEVSPVLLVALRFTLAGALLFLLFPKEILTIRADQVGPGVILGGLLFIGFALQTIGLKDTTASKSAFITGLMVIFTPLFQLGIEKRPPKRGNLGGILIVTAGLWLLTRPTGSAEPGSGFNIGDALTLGCAAVFGLYLVMLDVISKRQDPLPLTFLQMIGSAAFAWAILPFLETPVWHPTLWGIGMLLYLSILANLVSGYIQTRYQRDTTPTRAALIFTIEPVWASILGAVILGETLGPAGILGGILIIAGVLVSQLSDRQAEGRSGPD